MIGLTQFIVGDINFLRNIVRAASRLAKRGCDLPCDGTDLVGLEVGIASGSSVSHFVEGVA